MKKYLFLLLILILLTGCDSNTLVGKYVADEPDVLVTGDEVKESVEAYHLELKKDETFVLETGEDTINGTYEINEDKIFMQQDDGIVFTCEKTDANLTCDMYANKFTKQS